MTEPTGRTSTMTEAPCREQPERIDPHQLDDAELAQTVHALDHALTQAMRELPLDPVLDEIRTNAAELRIAHRRRQAARHRDRAQRFACRGGAV